jgi:transmembrane sensor
MIQASDQDLPSQAVTEAAQDWFLLLSSGSASSTDVEGFKAWCDDNASHAAAFDEVRALWNDIGDLRAAWAVQPVPPPAAQVRRRPARRPARRLVLGGLLAACLALVAVFAADLPTRFQADFSTAVGEQARFALPDGSTAHLNTGSAIALDFSPTRRKVTLLRGEAAFEVRPDPLRPFAVSALGGRATAVGTTYAVQERGEEALVTVLEGRVRVSAPAETGLAVDVTADRQVGYRRSGPPEPVRRVDAKALLAWQRGLVVIDALPLAEALAEIDRYHPGRILLFGGAAPGETVTARIELDSIDSGIRALAAIHGLSVTHVTDYLVIIR